MEQPTSHPTDSSTKQFGNNTTTSTQEIQQQTHIVIDASPETTTKEVLLNITSDLKSIIKQVMTVLS